MEEKYLKGSDGKFYQALEVSGETEYVPADPSLRFQELPDGSYRAVRSEEELRRQASDTYHHAFCQRMFNSLPKDPYQARNRIKHLDAVEKQFQQLMVDRVMPGATPDVIYVKDSEFERYREMYQQAFSRGEQARCDFQPLTAYAHKLITKSGKVLRELLAGEVGMLRNKIVCLEPGYGSGDRVSVPGMLKGTSNE